MAASSILRDGMLQRSVFQWLLPDEELRQCGGHCPTSCDRIVQPRPQRRALPHPNALPRLLCGGVVLFT
jgi:hypothetical protein